MRIERMDPSRAEEALTLAKAVFGTGSLSCFTNEANRFFIAEEDGKIVGFGGYSLAADQADIIDVAVAPSFRRQGIARALMHCALSDAASRGAVSVFLEVRLSNVGAIALYTSLGFTSCGKRKNYYKEPKEDALLMMRSLIGYKSDEE